jgi:hypothetical protein
MDLGSLLSQMMLSLTLVSGYKSHKSATAVSVRVENPPKMKIPYLKFD